MTWRDWKNMPKSPQCFELLRSAVKMHKKSNSKHWGDFGTFFLLSSEITNFDGQFEPLLSPASQLASQPAIQAASQPASQPASQLARQPASQPASKPSSQQACRPHIGADHVSIYKLWIVFDRPRCQNQTFLGLTMPLMTMATPCPRKS